MNDDLGILFEPAEREHGARPFGENEHANKAAIESDLNPESHLKFLIRRNINPKMLQI